MQFKDYYQILGVTDSASADEIKRAYRKKARQFHPDVSKEKDAEEQFKQVGEAYEVLRDPERRAEYDQLKKHGYRHGDDFRGGANWSGQWQPGAGSFAGGADFSEFFNAIFGSAGMGGGGFRTDGFGAEFGADFGPDLGAGRHAHGGNAYGRSTGEDTQLRVRVPLELAYKGGKTTIKVPASGGREARNLSVKIPPGVVEGQQLRLRGQGNAHRGRAGDLLITITIKPHDLFDVDGADVLLTVPVTPLEAIDGVTLSVPTPGGEVSLKIPPNTASGSKLRLRGRGLPASPAGDQYVTVQIAVPENLTSEQRSLLEQFDASVDVDPRAHLRRSSVA